MAEITAAAVKALRETSGAGMMDCKKALTETGGDMIAATDWLRAKGLATASKKSSRTAAEGLVGVAVNNGPHVEPQGQDQAHPLRPGQAQGHQARDRHPPRGNDRHLRRSGRLSEGLRTHGNP